MSDTYSSTADTQGHASYRGCGLFKRAWSALEIGAVIGGFVLFWPLGVAALALKWAKGEVWPGSANFSWKGAEWKNRDWSQWKRPQGFSSGWGRYGSSGNWAFDDYRRATLDRLEAERRKLEEEQRAFADYLTKLRQAKDKEEFDRFMSERSGATPKSE